VVLSTAGAAVALTLPAIAMTDSAPTPAPESGMVVALSRDLGVSTAEAKARLRTERWAAGTTQQLRRALADEYAGAWLNESGDQLTVAVTDPAEAETVRAAGARAKVVTHSAAELDAVKSELDSRTAAASDEISGWYVDVATNSVVVLAQPGATNAARRWAARSGAPAGSVRVVRSTESPVPLFDVRGADPFFIEEAARCSVGFSVEGGFVTAGHCGQEGSTTTGFNQEAQGTFEASSFPGDDFAFVAVNGEWTPRAVVNTSDGGEVPVAGSIEAPVGASICRSGSTTGTECGLIEAKNVTVQYPEGTVTGLTRTDVCAEPGDSGGSWISDDQAQGITSGGSGDCTIGGVTFFQPINEVLATLDLTLVTAGDEGQAPPAAEPPGSEPPAEDPPAAEEPPAEDPPAEDPPAEDPPAEDPPADSYRSR
jgi:streptogrisin C